MAFPRLTKCEGITRSFTLGYRITDNSGELWTERFDRFKNNDLSALCGGAHLLLGAVPELVQALGLHVNNTVFVTALASGETTARKCRPLQLITHYCAKIVGAEFILDALSKNVHDKIHNLYPAARRDEELEKANYKSKQFDKTNILVFDDFITRGATQSKIAQAIRSANPKSSVYAVALCKTERQTRRPNLPRPGPPLPWLDAGRPRSWRRAASSFSSGGRVVFLAGGQGSGGDLRRHWFLWPLDAGAAGRSDQGRLRCRGPSVPSPSCTAPRPPRCCSGCRSPQVKSPCIRSTVADAQPGDR
jgi:hypothetical protein